MTNKDLTEAQIETATVDNVEQLPEVKLHLYEISEAKLNMLDVGVSIFDLQLEDLIFEKMFLLFQKLQPAMKNLEKAKMELQDKKDKLLLETNFKEVLEESRPTVAMKEAYIKSFVVNEQQEVDKIADDITFYKDKINILNDLIKAQRTLLNIEGALKQ